MNIQCPNCGKSHYRRGASSSTAVYYPPIIKDGVNINPDRNTVTTRCECLECKATFTIKGIGEVISIKVKN